MQYWGKLLGVMIAILSGGGFWPIVLGLFIGHMVDQALDARIIDIRYFSDQQDQQNIFCTITFQVMGYLTKSKGRITEANIHNAKMLMTQMQLNDTQKNAAQEAFYQGKDNDFPLRTQLREFYQIYFNRFDLIRMFIEIQIQAALADGSLHPKERQVLYIIAEELGVNRKQFEQLLSTIAGCQTFTNEHNYSQKNYSQSNQPVNPKLETAYKILGVRPQDDGPAIKHAYRKLMKEYHPDKLVAKGLSPEMMEIAKQKTQAIQKAYNLLKRENRFR